MILAELSLNLPLLSAVFLLIAGVLVGYAIAFPLRGDSDTVVKELRAMREQNEDLETALQQQRDAYARLERRDQERTGEWLELQASARRMETALNERMPDNDPEIESLRKQSDAAQEELAQQRKKCTTLEARCQSQATSLSELRTAAEDYRDLQAKYNVLREELVQKAELLRRTEQQQEQTAAVVQEREDELRSASQSQAEFAEQKMSLSQKLLNLEAALSSVQSRLDESEVQRLAAVQQFETERGQRLAAEDQLEAYERQLRDATSDASMLEERDQELAVMARELQAAKSSLEQQAEVQRDAAEMIKALEYKGAHFEQEVTSHRRAFDTVERQRDELRASRDDLARRLKASEEEIERLNLATSRIDELQTETKRAGDQLRQAQTELQSLTARVREATVERDAALAQAAALQDSLDDIRQQVGRSVTDQDRLRTQREELLSALRKEERRRVDASSALDEQTRRISSLSDQIKQLVPLRDELATVRRQLAQREQQIEGLRVQADELELQRSELAGLRESLHAAGRAVAAAEEKTSEAQQLQEQQQKQASQYRSERDRALAELRSLKVATSQQAQQTPSRGSDGLQNHPKRGRIYATAPASPDDLKCISGIASVLESKLNQLGIYTYRQIMEWKSAEIAEFSKLLSFPDRIARDDWVGQAAALENENRSQAA